MTTAIALENVSFGYDRQPVVRDVTLSVDDGSFSG